MSEFSPEMKTIMLTIAGFVGKMVFDSVLNAFKNTLSTPARVTSLETNLKKELDDIKAWKTIHEANIDRNWEKFQALDKRVAVVENETGTDSRKAA